jgi:serine/threonine-protein kinase
MPPSRAAAIARDVARALEHAHAEGVIHRDIKPSNILISTKGQVKLIDFGLAVHDAGTPADRDSMYLEGSLHYLSPEQAQGLPLDGRSDIYSLGITLYEMLSGARPFQGKTESSVIAKNLHPKRPVLPVRKNGSVGPLSDILNTMLALRPEQRYPTARATADALRMFLAKRASPADRRPRF